MTWAEDILEINEVLILSWYFWVFGVGLVSVNDFFRPCSELKEH